MPDDTIFALSSGAPPAAIAVVRISGPAAGEALAVLAGARPAPRHAAVRTLRDADGAVLDEALVLWFPGPASVTGEDVAELHLHGGRAVIAAALGALGAITGLRAAEPGEFTRRALAAGRIDLAQAEGLADLLAAETETQRRTALRSAEGGVGREIGGWLVQLTDIAAAIEAEIDYGDEIDTIATRDHRVAIASLAATIEAALARPSVERLRDGVRIVLAGPPNSGKSSLINAMVERDVAIVSPVAGTTRDVVEATVVRDDRVYVVSDTAGLTADTSDPIEAIGIGRARDLIATGDLVLWLGDDAPPPSSLWLYARADLRPTAPAGRLATSITAPETIAALWRMIAVATSQIGDGVHQQLYNNRQRSHTSEALAALRHAAMQSDILLVADELRQATTALRRVMGYGEVEELLDALFARFCLGK